MLLDSSLFDLCLSEDALFIIAMCLPEDFLNIDLFDMRFLEDALFVIATHLLKDLLGQRSV